MKLHYYYDKEADVFYLSQGKPSIKSISEETSDDVILRLDPKTKQVKGFTILNFSHRLGKKKIPIELPIFATLTPAYIV